ncbi:site-specific tyrosine recombinase XerD [Streptococcus phocae subsp. phocae]
MITFIEPFISNKSLAENSQKSYRYDLQQFCHHVGQRINQDRLALYKQSLSSLSISAKKRKLSIVNQFLHYLYQENILSDYYHIDDKAHKITPKQPLFSSLELSAVYEAQPVSNGQLIALLILELGLTPNDIAHLKMADINLDFNIMTIQSPKGMRVVKLTKRLVPFLAPVVSDKQVYLFGPGAEPLSRQWYFNQLKGFLHGIGQGHLSAQTLREQFILTQRLSGKSIIEASQMLGLKSPITLEKYYKS